MNPINKFRKIYQLGVSVLNKYKIFLCKHDNKYASGYFKYVDSLIQSNEILDERKLQNQEWNEYNVRRGFFSIKGFISEIITVGRWNGLLSSTTCKLAPSDKSLQIAGVDVLFENSKWMQSYTGQVKTSNIAKTISIYPDWFKYDPKKVHRLVIVDSSKHIVLCTDYTKMVNLCNPLFFGRNYANLYTMDIINNLDRIKGTIIK